MNLTKNIRVTRSFNIIDSLKFFTSKVLDFHAPLKEDISAKTQVLFMGKNLGKAILNHSRVLNNFRTTIKTNKK